MSLITLNVDKKHFYLLLGILIFILEDLLVYKDNAHTYEFNCNLYFSNFISKIFLIIPYLITIRYQSKSKNIILKNKKLLDLDKIYNFKILPKNKKFRNFIIILLSLYIISELYSISIFVMIPNKLMKMHRYKLMFFIFLIYFYKIIFRKPIYMHHYLALIILFLLIFFFTLNNIYILLDLNNKSTHLFYILNDFLARSLDALNIILFKYLMEMCYMNGYLIFFIIGIIQIIFFTILNFISKFPMFEFPNSLIIIVYYFVKNFFFIFFINKYNPCLYGIVSFGYDLYFYFRYCIKKDANLKIELKLLFQIFFVLSFVFLFIFSETIQFNFWGLNKHTFKFKK